MDDFKDPIKIEADEGSIVGAAVTYMSRPGIAAKICSDLPNESNFTPVLMNPGDSVDIQVITDSCPEPPKLTTWIREESRPMQRRQTIIDPSCGRCWKGS
jgi:hypothetical protein